MIVARIENCTRELGKAQGYVGLQIRDEIGECTVAGRMPTMTSAWEPTPDELSRLAAGAKVEVTIGGMMHPPIQVNVGQVPEGEPSDG